MTWSSEGTGWIQRGALFTIQLRVFCFDKGKTLPGKQVNAWWSSFLLPKQPGNHVPLLFVTLISKRWSLLITFTRVTTRAVLSSEQTPHFHVKNVRFCMLHRTCPLVVSASCAIVRWEGCDVNSDKGSAAGVCQERARMTYGLLATLFPIT